MSEKLTQFSEDELKEIYFGFPEGLDYKTFASLSRELREYIVQQNPIIQTDTYNRTMEQIRQEEWDTTATYVLQLRRSPHNYHIVSGVHRVVEEIVRRPITQSMLDFAREFYQHRANVPFFNEEKRQQVIDKHRGVLPFEIDALPDGTAALPGDPLIRITGPNELVAHFEPKIH